MLNPESVDKEKCIVTILFTDDKGDECLRLHLEVMDARRMARIILKRTDWREVKNESHNR